jgi:hypothetical protein
VKEIVRASARRVSSHLFHRAGIIIDAAEVPFDVFRLSADPCFPCPASLAIGFFGIDDFADNSDRGGFSAHQHATLTIGSACTCSSRLLLLIRSFWHFCGYPRHFVRFIPFRVRTGFFQQDGGQRGYV